MSKRLFIIAIPGSGTKKQGFTTKLQKDLKRFTKKSNLKDNYTVVECLPYNQTGIDSDTDAILNRLTLK